MREKGIDGWKKTVSFESLMGYEAIIDTSAITDVNNNLTLINMQAAGFISDRKMSYVNIPAKNKNKK